MEEYIIYVVDTETTGLLSTKNDVIEISACRFNLNDLNNISQKTWLLKALNPSTIQDDALRINGHKREDILHLTKFGKDNYKEPSDAIVEIEQWIMEDGMSSIDRVFAGQNPIFDIKAMKELWKRVGSPDTFPFMIDRGERIIDTKMLALIIDLCTGKRRQFYNLMSLVKSFGTKKSKAHTASGDVEMTTDIMIKIISGIKNVVNEQFKENYTDETT